VNFKNEIEGMILNVPVAASLGVPNRIAKNIGSMENLDTSLVLTQVL
jgi:hypothetical protein